MDTDSKSGRTMPSFISKQEHLGLIDKLHPPYNAQEKILQLSRKEETEINIKGGSGHTYFIL